MKLKIVYREINKAENWFFRGKKLQTPKLIPKKWEGEGVGERRREKENTMSPMLGIKNDLSPQTLQTLKG